MKTPDRLLAKSVDAASVPKGAQLLLGHSAMVASCAELLLQERGAASMRAARLPGEMYALLDRVVRFASWIHDFGKCSLPFQEMLRGSNRAQPIRHEALTLWMAWPGQPLGDWLLSGSLAQDELKLAAVVAAGHHRKFPRGAIAQEEAGAGVQCDLLCDHQDFAQLLETMGAKLGLLAPPGLPRIAVRVTGPAPVGRSLARWASNFSDLLDDTPSFRQVLPIAKAFVLAADVAGSALPRSDKGPKWIVEELRRRAPSDRLLSVVTDRLAGAQPRPFQEDVGNAQGKVTLVRAGCGSGKTAAAFLWASRQHAGRQLWFAYPTTGTATEGFRDYVMEANVAARLEHGRAHVDMAMVLGDDATPSRELDRLAALRSWGSEVVTCTVDTVLGLVQNQRKGLYAWPGLCDAAIVFDEIHAYDERLFGSLFRFLEALPGIPVLLMTASLPRSRQQALESLCQRIHGVSLRVVDGPADLELLERYQRSRIDPDAAWQMVEAEIGRGGKVLWVSNTVDRAVAVYDEARHRFPSEPPLLYHSRYRYRDRVERHSEVIAAFGRPGAALASTTQVAEMSLDLSATLLVTDEAPIPALIQRLGRLNRRAVPSQVVKTMPFIVLPFDGLPYDKTQLKAARSWLERLGDGSLSQRALVEAWFDDGLGSGSRECANWLDGDFDTEPAAVREASPGISVLREADADEARRFPSKLTELVIPMGPFRGTDWRAWPRVNGVVPAAPDQVLAYDSIRGGSWQK